MEHAWWPWGPTTKKLATGRHACSYGRPGCHPASFQGSWGHAQACLCLSTVGAFETLDNLVDKFVQGGLCEVKACMRAVPLQAKASVLQKRDVHGMCRHSISVNFQIRLNSQLVDGGVSEMTWPGEGDAPGIDLVQDEQDLLLETGKMG